jgi:hypothetical protein
MTRWRTVWCLSVMCLLVLPVGAQDYVGHDACQPCHSAIYGEYIQTGHPYKLNKVVDGQPPEYPFTEVLNPPEGFTWDDITYVIGGYNWKARFIDQNGFIITGDAVQWNLENQTWSGYHADEEIGTKPYNCGRCHTTGWQTVEDNGGVRQDGLDGMAGTFAAPGVECEGCHGPGSDHVAGPNSENIQKDSSKELCGRCHTRDAERRIAASGGLIRHHEQYDELVNSPHRFMECGNCHDPHKSVLNDLGGTTNGADCTACHAAVAVVVPEMAGHDCKTCHMPKATKSAIVTSTFDNEGDTGLLGDIQSHTFKLNTDPDAVMFSEDGKLVLLDDEGDAIVRVEYACGACHNGSEASAETVDWMYANAAIVHTGGMTAVAALEGLGTPGDFVLHEAYPNPFNPTTHIRYDLPAGADVRFVVHNAIGATVSVIVDERQVAGRYLASWDGRNAAGNDVASGVYFARLEAGPFSKTTRMTLVR